MENNKKDIKQEKNNNYLLRSIYLIRKELPSSYIFYLILFFCNYLGAIICSRIPETAINSNYFSINKFLTYFLIFGKNYSLRNYDLFCILGAIFLLFYLLFISYCFMYMKNKYINISSLKEYKIRNLGQNKKLENTYFKIITYIFIIIIFFRQYILEYYFFSIYSLFFYIKGEFRDNISTSINYDETHYSQIYLYFSTGHYIICFVLSLFVIFIISCFLFIFMLLSSIKGLFLENGYAFSDNKKYMIVKMVLLNLQPFYGISLIYKNNIKVNVGIIIDVILIIFCLFNFYSSFHQFGFYPCIVTNFCLFMEFYIFVSSISQIIFLLTKINNNSNLFIVVRLFIEIIDAIFLKYLFINQINKYNLNLFSMNIFSTNFKSISKGGFYYYMKAYEIYEEDKNNNYTIIFNIIRNHVNYCNKNDCPGKILISKNIRESIFIPMSKNSKKKNNDINIDEICNLDLSDSMKSIKIENNSDLLELEKDENKENEEKLKKQNTIIPKGEMEKIKEKSELYPKSTIIDDKYKLTDKQFQMIFEQEIINRIDYLNKRKNYFYMEDYIFIHLQYLLKIKKNYPLTLYYVGKYYTCGINWSFNTLYFLYEYKKYLISIYYRKTNLLGIDETVNKYRKENHFLKEVIHYFIYCSILRSLIINSCKNLKLLFSLRKDLHNNILLKSYQRSKTRQVLHGGENLQKCIKDIGIVLKKHNDKYDRKLFSPELSYLISNFYIFVMNKIPFEIRKYVEPKLDFNSIVNHLESGYRLFNFTHPLILSLTNNNTFSIGYFSNLICTKLGYLSNELINQDFHEKIFPGNKFIKEHEIIMKQFLFCENNSVGKNKTFLKSKDGYLVGVKLKIKKLPTFFCDFYFIIDVEFRDDFYNSEINKSFNRYSFLLDENFEFISLTKNFYEDFEFNVKMFKEIRTNFLEFFCIDQSEISKKIKKYGENKKILIRNSKNISNFLKKNDAFTVFKNINYENVFTLRNIIEIDNIRYKPIIFKDKIDKNKIIKTLPEFSKLIEENGLDCEWYQHIENFRQRLLVKDIIEEEDSREDSIIDKKNEIIRNSFIYNASPTTNHNGRNNFSFMQINNNKNLGINNSNIIVNIDNGFEIIYSFKRICNIRYCLVDLCEKTKYLYDEDDNEINDNNDNENQKLFLQKSVNYKKKIKGGRLSITKGINTRLTLVDDNDVVKNNKLYENKDINIKNINNLKITKSKTSEFKLERKSFKKFNDNIELIEEESERQYEEKMKNLQKTEIYYVKTDDKKNNTEIINRFQSKTDNNFLSNKLISNSPNINDITDSKINNSANKENEDSKLKTKKTKEQNKNKENNENEKYLIDSFDMLGSPSKSKRKTKKEEEEKILLLTQNELEDFIKGQKKKHHNSKIILFIIFLLILILLSIKIILLLTSFSVNTNLIITGTLFQMIKMDIYLEENMILCDCINISNLVNNTFMKTMKYTIRTTELREHVTVLERNMQELQNNRHFKEIFKSLYSNITYIILNNDWNFTEGHDSYFLKELNYIVYLLSEVAKDKDITEKCALKEEYFNIFLYNITEMYNNFGEPTLEQKILYYISRNFIGMKQKFSEIEEELAESQIKVIDDYCSIIIKMTIVIGILFIIGEITILYTMQLDSNFVLKIFLYFYHYEKKQLQFEYEIYYLEKATKEFNIDNIYLLENIKKCDDYYIYLVNLAKNKINNIYDKNYQENKKSENDKNNSSVLNQSVGGNSSMVQLINNKNNNNLINSNNDINNNLHDNNLINIDNKKLNEDEKMLKENEESIYILKSNKKLIPATIIFSMWFSIFITIGFITIIIVNIIHCKKNNNLWKYSVYLSMNIMQKIPKSMELLIFTDFFIISGILDILQFLPKNEYLKTQPTYLRYFTYLKGYDISNLVSENLGDSSFTNLLLDNLRIKRNIEYSFQDNNHNQYFNEFKLLTEKLNEPGYFCFNSVISSVDMLNIFIPDIYTFFELINDMSQNCIECSDKISETGLDLELNYIYQQLTYTFIDFYNSDFFDRFSVKYYFFDSKDIQRITNDMDLPFYYAFNSIIYSLRQDMSLICQTIKKNEIIFDLITYIFAIVIIILILSSIYFNQKDKKLFEFLASVLKRN